MVSVASVGGIRSDLGPGTLVVPHQIIDYTWGRRSTFFEGAGAPVNAHRLHRAVLARAARKRCSRRRRRCGETVADGGVYAATQGPRLETAAEIDRLERDGADLVGMTGMPEAALAREVEPRVRDDRRGRQLRRRPRRQRARDLARQDRRGARAGDGPRAPHHRKLLRDQ